MLLYLYDSNASHTLLNHSLKCLIDAKKGMPRVYLKQAIHVWLYSCVLRVIVRTWLSD